MEQKEDFYLTGAPVKKLLIKFSIPCILSMLVSALYNIVDQIFIGIKLKEAGIYATTVVYPFTVITFAFALLIGDGCAALFSISMGAKDTKTAKKSVGNALIMSLSAGIILMILGFALRNPILHLCGVTPDCYKYAMDYFNIILIGIPFFVLTASLSSIIRADGSPKYSMIATVVGAVINLVLDPIMILGFNWGIMGAAIATIIGQIVSTIIALLYFRKTKLVKLEKESFKPSFKMMGKVARLGISSFIIQFAIAAITVVANDVIRAINDPVLGASGPGGVLGVVFKVFGIVMAFSVGVSVGGQPIIGYNYGAKNYKRVFETYKYILIVNVIVGIIATILFEACPIIFAKIFSISDALQNFACLSFRIYLGGILFCCIQKASCIFLQAINKPYKSMILSLMRDVVFLVPGVCILGLCGNLTTMLWAEPITDALSFLLTIVFVYIEYKRLIKNNHTNIEESIVKDISPSKNFAITIDREFGSGGKYIAQELAKRFKIKCFDNEILTKLAKDTNIDIGTLKTIDENEKTSFWYGFATNYTTSDNTMIVSAEDGLFFVTSQNYRKSLSGTILCYSWKMLGLCTQKLS